MPLFIFPHIKKKPGNTVFTALPGEIKNAEDGTWIKITAYWIMPILRRFQLHQLHYTTQFHTLFAPFLPLCMSIIFSSFAPSFAPSVIQYSPRQVNLDGDFNWHPLQKCYNQIVRYSGCSVFGLPATPEDADWNYNILANAKRGLVQAF